MTSLEYYIEQIEQFISALTDDIESGEGTVVTRTKLAVYREVLEHLEEIEQERSYNSIKTELKPCDDAVSRQSAIFLASDLKQDLPDDERIADMVMAHNEGVSEYQTQLSLLPSVTPQPKTGHWRRELIRNEKGGCIGAKMICSECGNDNKHDEYMTYCPNCGAKMSES